ncbi:right-handed parallel beta-helix repeat-containing protein [Plebeiibacterium sediminum]|uniref:Right-handed parallel beta-helix repeat-containing protein n=1 Tax=Plebeiibacterium sediminum TaxID=2992112 RepID=A0AAE3SDY5_9BACT|nr:right-handed parallel beta-helix repeat-containing protein [Plebeiobacterium sediminum]MCW3785581.1 right-handed parallel beta-helix repeat-containing protein [Plebeiobacterium sediminum]
MCKLTYFIFVVFLLSPVFLRAQPSGGPYGPVQKTYELPEVSGTIYFVSPEGNSNADGLKLTTPTTIESALEKVNSGDAIVMRGGTYRSGDLKFNQGITIQPYKDETPVIKGTKIASEWEHLENGLWRTSWDLLFPSEPQSWWRRHRHGTYIPLHRFNNDMVFVDGKFLQSAGWEGEVNENTYYIDYKNHHVYIGIDPKNKQVEITAFSRGLIRTTVDVHGKKSDKIGPVVRGIEFSQYPHRIIDVEGYYPEGLSNDSDHGNDVVGTTFENCTMSFCARMGVNIIGDNFVFRNCKISDTSTEGLYVVSSDDILIEKNIFTRNNIEILDGYYPAAVKIFNQCYRAVFRDNLVIDLPESNGVWYDVGNVDGVFVNNYLQGVGAPRKEFSTNSVYPSRNAFFFEISKGAICAGNVFNNCDHGCLILNSNNVKVFNNTFVNSLPVFGRTARSAQNDHFGWHPSTGPDVDERTGHQFVNNIVVNTEKYQGPLLFVAQPEDLCSKLKVPSVARMSNNIWVNTVSDSQDYYVVDESFVNSKAPYKTLKDVSNTYPEFGKGSIVLTNYKGPLFKCIEIGDFHLSTNFLPDVKGSKLPKEIDSVVKLSSDKKTIRVGAY